MADVPREFHFIFGLRPQTEPFHLLHYLCLESCRRIHRPRKIHLHLRHLPHGEWWQRIAPQLQIHSLDPAPLPFDPARYADTDEGRLIAAAGFSYAHEADFVRLQILLQHGGVYADMDTLFVRPYPDDFYAHEFLIGEETVLRDRRGILRPSLCNALMFAKSQAKYGRAWLARMGEVFDGTWNRHSCDEAARLWASMPESVTVAPATAFYPFAATRLGIAELFERQAPLPRAAYSVHLWAHLWWHPQRTDFTEFHAGRLTLDHLQRGDTTYTRLARTFLDPE